MCLCVEDEHTSGLHYEYKAAVSVGEGHDRIVNDRAGAVNCPQLPHRLSSRNLNS